SALGYRPPAPLAIRPCGGGPAHHHRRGDASPTEDIIAALGRFSYLSVIAHTAVQPYKGKPLQPCQLNCELGVCYALEGSVCRNGNQVLITAQLVDALSGRLLWSDSSKLLQALCVQRIYLKVCSRQTAEREKIVQLSNPAIISNEICN